MIESTDPSTHKVRQFCQTHAYAFALTAIALLSFTLNFYNIQETGYGNAYYAAAIKSMTQSFHNFFFVAFDPAGVVSVDKPPLGLWVQAIFVLLFGYKGWVMLLPQALAGTGSALMLYTLTAKPFGKRTGLLSALIFSVTPAVIVASRNNTMDMQLIFALLVSVWFFFKALETGKWRYLFLCAVWVGLGFNIKMLQAYMILPAIALVYLFFAKERLLKRFIAGILSVGIVFCVSFLWVFIVDTTPASERPYVGSSTNNTVMELITGHNGVERLSGGMGGGGGRRNGNTNNMPPQMQDGNGGQDGRKNAQQNATAGNNPQNGGSFTPQQGGTPPGGRTPSGNGDGPAGGRGAAGGAGNDIGTAGPLRLFSSSLYGQISWLLPLAILSFVAAIRKFHPKKERTLRQASVWFWGLWLFIMVIFFSFAGFYHRYYLCMVAPGIAALCGIGLPQMFHDFKEASNWRKFLLPVSCLATVAIALPFIWSYSQLQSNLFPLILGTGVLGLTALVISRLKPRKIVKYAATCLLTIALLAGPLYWCLTVTLYPPENSTMPYAGPELASTTKTPGMTKNQGSFTATEGERRSLENYLVKNYKEGSYLVVAQSANDVADFIVETGLPAVAYGGFLGSDDAISLEELKQLVREGKVTYFLLSDTRGGGMRGSSNFSTYVKENATQVDASEYGGSESNSGTLYRFTS